jgi:hypothetical protein
LNRISPKINFSTTSSPAWTHGHAAISKPPTWIKQPNPDKVTRIKCSKLIKELSERAHIPHTPHIVGSNAKFLK